MRGSCAARDFARGSTLLGDSGELNAKAVGTKSSKWRIMNLLDTSGDGVVVVG